jgi:hypothetical protein
MSGLFRHKGFGWTATKRAAPVVTPTGTPGTLDFSRASNSALLLLLDDI